MNSDIQKGITTVILDFVACVFQVIMVVCVAAGIKKKMNTTHDESDISCETQYGHDHSNDYIENDTRHYVVREKVEPGYVIINGVKKRIDDCE